MAFTLPTDYTKLTTKQRKIVREQYVLLQKGLCSVCKHKLSDPPKEEHFTINKKLFPIGFFNNPVHLHHNHDTGMTIGAVHAKCNAIRWQYFGE
jgi:hypothetical protein